MEKRDKNVVVYWKMRSCEEWTGLWNYGLIMRLLLIQTELCEIKSIIYWIMKAHVNNVDAFMNGVNGEWIKYH